MEDPRCCGTGTCIINAEGLCWCGQRWDGVRMSFPEPAPAHGDTPDAGESRSTKAQNNAPAPD
jgi:hypothetical protein